MFTIQFNVDYICYVFLESNIAHSIERHCLSFYRTDLRNAKFTKFRLKSLPILDYNADQLMPSSNATSDGRNIAVEMRYLLDLVLNKSTKYDYLRKLALGISPGTRIYYDNTKIHSKNEALPAYQRKLARLVDLQRMLHKDSWLEKRFISELKGKYVQHY